MVNSDDIIVLHNDKNGKRTDPFSESFLKKLEKIVREETKAYNRERWKNGK